MQTLSNGDTAVYDAWGRLVEVDGTSGTVEQCEYDGTGRRVQSDKLPRRPPLRPIITAASR